MYIKVCDRCGRTTENGPAFFDPDKYGIMPFGSPVILCNNCLIEFNEFRYSHLDYNSSLKQEDSKEYLEKLKKISKI